VLLNNRTVVGVDWGSWAMSNPDDHRAMLDELIEMVQSGRLHPVEPTERRLEDAAEVMAALLDRTVTGKVVLVP
jgi:NADPH2:quinone reductase